MTTSKSDDIGKQMQAALGEMGMGNTEIEGLIRIIAGGLLGGPKDVLAATAALQAGLTLAGIVLNDLHRIADAQEIMAKATLDNAKPLFGGK
jgi:hypothetical protein